MRGSYTRSMQPLVPEGLKFLWTATRGHRLRPWRSEYLRWRMETYTGRRADEVSFKDFWNLLTCEKRQFLRFLRWTGEIRSIHGEPK